MEPRALLDKSTHTVSKKSQAIATKGTTFDNFFEEPFCVTGSVLLMYTLHLISFANILNTTQVN